ncbi:hypothetical protein DCAR_0415949 [Daucus carota subsp. sativus]|uniref:Uncharacterized protein n=1 Tax=Daucus carota subsp. sativus TaxID=79200 RepID=A0A162A8U0_DAUCS|nr:PREDICTED: uncharacterized protein LOC108217986 [Daucus carota subsp. sativus]WOG96613.1 hypothetical protein DCAR_0415949 [Daucus carota subsp. sativus]
MASSILSSNTAATVVLATAMAVSGTVIVLALRLQKFSINYLPKSCISSDNKKRERKKKKVHFAEDVIDPIGNGEEFRKRFADKNNRKDKNLKSSDYKVPRELSANRMALYNGILRDRVVNRTAYSY